MRLSILYKALVAGAFLFCGLPALAQEPAAQPQQPVAPVQPISPKDSSSIQPPKKGAHSDDFLVRGTVFTPDGMSFPGAELFIRRTTEKKFKWNTATNSRGEFAVRVKMGGDYQVVVRAKGFQELSQAVDAKSGERFKDLVFHMQRQEGKK